MARKKRLNVNGVLTGKSVNLKKEDCSIPSIQLKTALYARLSVEDNGKEDGESLENQIDLLKAFVKGKKEFEDWKLYTDNGVTGTVFNRPAFNEMIEDMKAGKIQCIIVKDLSRLGRNYLEAGSYIEQIFPFYHLRFISVLDGYDSFAEDATDIETMMPVKNLMNDFYAKDISRKVCSTFRAQQNKGMYIGSFAPLGYKKDPDDMYHLVIDPETADLVKSIFSWKLQGKSLGKIVRMLNDSGVPTRFRRLYEDGLVQSTRYKNSLWTRKNVKALLTNEVYIGCIVSGKEVSYLAEGYHKKKNDPERWIRHKNMHEPIISEKEFDKVQRMLEEAEQRYWSHYKTYECERDDNLFKGKIRCGLCGEGMGLIKQLNRDRQGNPKKLHSFYECRKYQITTHVNCKDNKVDKAVLDEIVLNELKLQLHILLDLNQANQFLKLFEEKAKPDHVKMELQKMEQSLAKNACLYQELYEDYRNGIIDDTDYMRLRKQAGIQKKQLNKSLKQLKNIQNRNMEKEKKKEQLVQQVGEYIDVPELSKKMVDTFIERIDLYDGKKIKITYKFSDELQELRKEIAQGKRGLTWLRNLQYTFVYQKKMMMSKALQKR